MKYAVPDHDAPLSEDWLEPLYAITEAVRYVPAYQFFDEYDFMVMAKLIRSGRPNITLFKHRYTRRYLNLDIVGRAYRFIPPANLDSKSHGRYVVAPSLEWALDSLFLWELPWMKDELAKYRFGLPPQESWRLNPRYDPRRFLVDEMRAAQGYAEDWSLDDDVDELPCAEPRRLRLVRGDDEPF